MASRTAALLGLIAVVEAARHGHGHHHHRHQSVAEDGTPLEKRGGQCQFPTDAGLVAITPDQQNAGWAMSPNQPCLPGHYCPYACPPGQVSMQWDPKATSYTYPQSMNGGLYCDENGEIQKPFPDKPYCQDGTGAVVAINKAGGPVSFCQTVLPGNEAMLIPTLVEETATLAVPDPSYWCSTAAHYYINPPGVGTETACVWGTSANPYGNWSPYVAGANTDGDGNTFVKLGWNPIYLEPSTPFRDQVPEFGVEIVCEGDGCNGLPCKIDPAVHAVNKMEGKSSEGAGGASFCVVTVPSGGKANIVVFGKGDGSSSASSSAPTSSSSVASSFSSSTSTTSSASTSSMVTTTSTSTHSSSTSSSSSSSSSSKFSSSSNIAPSSATASSSKVTQSWSSEDAQNGSASYTYAPHVFVEGPSSAAAEPTAAATGSSTAAQTTQQGAASLTSASMLSLSLGSLVAGVLLNF